MQLYQAAFEKLIAMDLAYPCSCSRKDLAEAVRAPHQEEPVYPGFCRLGFATDKPILSYRMRVGAEPVEFVDAAFGQQSFVGGVDFGDFVLWRPDSGPSYHLACAVDDGLLGITEVVRGADLLTSTARQILILKALGYAIPQYYHCPLVKDQQGVRLAKRHDALSLRELRQQGLRPEELHKIVTS